MFMRGKWNWMALGVWVFAGCMMVGGLAVAHAATYDATGAWTYKTHSHWVNPVNAYCDADSDETMVVSITQTGDDMYIVIDGKQYSGTVSGETYTGKASYSEDGGTADVTVEFTLYSNSGGNGEFFWYWEDDEDEKKWCTGRSLFSLTKNSASTPYDATGTWTYTMSDNWVDSGTAECSADTNETVTVTIEQTDTTVRVVIKGQTYSGTVSGATYNGTASYSEDDGTTTASVTFTLTSDSAGSGSVEWRWTGDGLSCNGGGNISLTKGSSGNSGDSGGSGCLINSLFGN
jgi:hypothetical protein